MCRRKQKNLMHFAVPWGEPLLDGKTPRMAWCRDALDLGEQSGF